MDPHYQSGDDDYEYYLAEMAMTGSCPTEVNTGLEYDPRYYESGLHTNDYDVQMDSGVMHILSRQSMIYDLSPPDDKESW